MLKVMHNVCELPEQQPSKLCHMSHSAQHMQKLLALHFQLCVAASVVPLGHFEHTADEAQWPPVSCIPPACAARLDSTDFSSLQPEPPTAALGTLAAEHSNTHTQPGPIDRGIRRPY